MTTVDSYSNPVTLSGETVQATLTGPSGQHVSGSLDLNTVIGNVNGALSWGGSGFASEAQNVTMTDGHTLAAQLPDASGNLVHSELLVGSGYTSHDGQDAVQFGVVPPYSTAHADANDNSQADQTVHAQASSADPSIVAVQTVQGDAADYWPEGNAPAAGSSHSGKIATKLAVRIVRIFSP